MDFWVQVFFFELIQQYTHLKAVLFGKRFVFLTKTEAAMKKQ